MSEAELEQLARRFFGAYAEGELDRARELLADDVVAYVTNAEVGVDVVEGPDAYMSRIPDLRSAGASIAITQVLPIDEERVMTMVEIRAAREGRTLHNFAAFLARCAGGRISELWMVDAKPAYSDEFWS